jgi:hypothetical protein
MATNVAGEDFCVKCGHPLSSYAAIGPLERIRTQGFLFRGAMSGPRSWVVLVGMWLICFTTLFRMAIALMDGAKVHYGLGFQAPMAFVFVLFGAILWKVTRNHRGPGRDAQQHEDDNAGR